MRKVSWMKGRIIIVIAACVATIFAGVISCSGKNIQNNTVYSDEAIEGWINEDTYQLAAGGMPVRSLKAIDQRKESARLDAITNARCQIIEKLLGVRIKKEELKNNDMGNISVPEEIKEIVKSGIVKKTVWDYDENCEIIFEIKSTGLKKKYGERAQN